MELIEVYSQESNASSVANSKVRTASRDSDGSSMESFSKLVSTALKSQISSNDKITTSGMSATLDQGDGTSAEVTFNNKTGAITWNGQTLDLKGFANALTDDLAIKNNNGLIEVYNLTTNKKMTLSANGTQMANSVVEYKAVGATLSIAMFINNNGKAADTGDNNDIIINRQAGACINAGGGDDKIFNFAASAKILDGGGGNDSVYSIGLNSGTTIDVSSGNGYVNLIGDMLGGSINLGTGKSYINASGRTLSGVRVSDSIDSAASIIVAKAISGKSQINLNAKQTAVDVNLLSSSQVSFGSGTNSLVADQVIGKGTDRSSVTSTGTNNYKIGTMTLADINSANAKSDAIKITTAATDAEFNLSSGNNLLDATGKTLGAVKITSQEGKGSTTVRAGIIAGKNAKTGMASINLAGTGNTIIASKALRNANISTGNGESSISTGLIDSVNLTMGGLDNTQNQTLKVTGAVSNMNYTGSKGDDSIDISGAVNNSNFELGDGNNRLNVSNAKNVAQSVTNTNIKSSGQGSSTLNMGNFIAGTAGNSIALGAGANTITVGNIVANKTKGLNLSFEETSQTQTLNAAGVSYLNYAGSSGIDKLSFTGAVTNSEFDLGTGDNSFVARNAAGVGQSVSYTNIKSSGDGTNDLSMGSYAYNTKGNTIDLAAGANTVNMGSISGNGTAGLKISTAATDKTQMINVGAANRLTYAGSSGDSNITVGGVLNNSNFDLGTGQSTMTVSNAKNILQSVNNTNIKSTGQNSTNLTMGNYTSNVDGNSIELGSGANSINIGNIAGSGKGLNISFAETTQTQILNVNSAQYLNYKGSSGSDKITVNASVGNSSFDLGDGADEVTVKGNLDARMILGKGTDNINVAGTMSGKLQSESDLELNSGSLLSMEMDLSGAHNKLNVTSSIGNSTINLGQGEASVGTATVAYSSTKITGGNNSNVITGSSYKDGSIILGEGDNKINISGTLSTNINLGTGTNTVGTETTSIKATTFTSNGTNTITGKELLNSNIGMGAASKSNKLLISGAMNASTITLNGGENTVGGVNATLNKTNIIGTAAGKNNISAASMTEGSINLGQSDDHVDIFGNINSATINLGEGSNSLRNTLSKDQAGMASTMNGSTFSNTVKNSKITLGGNTNVYLGDVLQDSAISGTGSNNINAAKLAGNIDASDMSGSYIGAGIVTGNINAGTAGTINVNDLEKGTITDNKGQNNITVGTMAETATISTGEAVNSSTVHVNNLGGTLNLGNAEYAEGKSTNITITNPYISKTTTTTAEDESMEAGTVKTLGTIKVAGKEVNEADFAGIAKDTSSFGTNAGKAIPSSGGKN